MLSNQTVTPTIEIQFSEYMSCGFSKIYPATIARELGKSANQKDNLYLMKWRDKFYYAEFNDKGELKPRTINLSTGNE